MRHRIAGRVALPRASPGAAGVGGFKTAWRLPNVIASNTMARPQRALNDAEAAQVDGILRAVGLLEPASLTAD
ncbi:MAG: hypothetical protein JOY70_09215 [Acidisphaera sp.]|nr:hypothetical protein [Acidisphaera sp.]MBV9812747.1 hypothetical protein [Acetobacteraceae bacterium]